MAHFVPFHRYKFADSYFVGGALSRVIAEVADRAAVEIESGAGQRLGGLHETQEWVALYGRSKYLPWNNHRQTTIVVSSGLNYGSSISAQEFYESGNGKGLRLPH